MKTLVTGANGLLGRHVRCYLASSGLYSDNVISIDHKHFNNKYHLESSLKDVDIVIHCAGVNRGEESEVEQANLNIAENLVEALSLSGNTPHIFYTNSIQKASDTGYGRGKQAAHELISKWAKSTGANYTQLILPHIFGEGGKPYYNSAIHTFCHQLVNGEEMKINGKGELELVHAQDVAAIIIDAFERKQTGELRVDGCKLSVAEVAGKLIHMYQEYFSGVIPDLSLPIDLQLFNTLRSFMYPAFYPVEIKQYNDSRGSLFEAVRNFSGGQVFLSTTRPGITRGNHYHRNKVERFLVIKGNAVIKIRHILDDAIREFFVCGDTPAYVDIPTLHTHSITNIGNTELLTLFWCHEHYNSRFPDTYSQSVMA